MKIQIKILPSKKTKDFTLKDDCWNADYNENLVSQYLRMYTVNQHQGTAKTQNRGDVTYGGRKVHQQKGLGKARAGTRSSPIRRGGAVAHGHEPYTRRLKISKRMSKQAFRSAMSLVLKEQNIVFWDYENELTEKYVKAGLQMLIDLEMRFDKVGIVVPKSSKMFRYMFNNLPQVSLFEPRLLNVHNVVSVNKLLVYSDSINVLEERLC